MTRQSAGRLDDLVKLLDRMHELHEELLGVVRLKVDAMKRAAPQEIRALGEREMSIVAAIHEREGLRRQLMDLLAKDMRLSSRAARSLSLRQLATRVPPAYGSALAHAGDRLRQVASRVAAANRIAAETARRVVEHVQWVFASVRPREAQPMGYSPRGAVVPAAQTTLLDALG